MRLKVALAVAAALTILALPGGAYAADGIYWADAGNNTISHANLDGSGALELDTGTATLSEPNGLVLDAAAGRIYWANYQADTISYANLDGSGRGNLVIVGATVDRPSGLALDPANGRLYWANAELDTISSARLDGSDGRGLPTGAATVDKPQGVALDLAGGRIFWSNRSGGKISFTSLDGSGAGGDLPTGMATVESPLGLAIDATADKVYWTNLDGNEVSYAALDGSGAGGDLNTGTATVKRPEGIAIDPEESRLYWANSEGGGIAYARLDGSGGADLPTPGASFNQPNLPALLKAPEPAPTLRIPEISGQHLLERPLFCDQGAWMADLPGAFLFRAPQSFSYGWLRNGDAIENATESRYRPTKPGTYNCLVTATNAAGSTVQRSADLTLERGYAYAKGFAPVHGRRALVTLTCVGDGRCKGLVKLIAHVGYHRVVYREGRREVIRRRALFPIGKASFSIFPGRTRVVHVKLKRKGKRLLTHRRGRRMRVRLLGRDVQHRSLLLKAGS
jgi:sugar lactone lactonase YvrE